MKKIYKSSLGLVAIAMLVAGCATTSAEPSASTSVSVAPSADTSTSVAPSADPSTPVDPSASIDDSDSEEEEEEDNSWIEEGTNIAIDDDMIAAVSGANITLEGRYEYGTVEYGHTSYGLKVKMNDGLFAEYNSTMAEDFTSGEAFPYTTSITAYADENGALAIPHAPDLMNEVATVYNTPTATIAFEDTIFINLLGELEASWFEIDREYVGQGYRLKVADDSLADAEGAIGNLISTYLYLGSKGEEDQEIYLYTDGKEITGVGFLDYDYSNADYDITFYNEGYLAIKDVGTTKLELDDVTYAPYCHDAAEDTYYEAFEDALAKLDEHNYTFSAVCTDEDDAIVKKSKGYVTPTGWSGYEEAITYDDEGEPTSDAVYYGVHAVADGKYNYYNGNDAAVLYGVSNVDTAFDSLPEFAFSPEIWTYNATKSTAGQYVFTVSDEILEDYYLYGITSKMTYDSYAKSAIDDLGAKLVINSDGTIKSFEFCYEDDEDNIYTFAQEYSDYGTTVIPAEIADFTDYVPYSVPTNYGELLINDMTMQAALDALFGTEFAAEIPFAITEATYDAYVGGIYSAANSLIQLVFAPTFSTVAEAGAFTKLLADALTAGGAVMTVDPDRSYVWTGTYTSGVNVCNLDIFYTSTDDFRLQFSLPTVA